MPTLLLCSPAPLEPLLGDSVLLRGDIARLQATRAEEARLLALAARPELVLVDAELPRALGLIEALRAEPATRALSVAVLLRRGFETTDVVFIEAGANAVLPLVPGRELDARLGRLLSVPARRGVRLPVRLDLDSLRSNAARGARALALDLSESGMCLEVLAPLRVGDAIAFALRLADGAPVGGRARVVRQSGETRYGLEFVALAARSRQQIGRFVARADAGAGPQPGAGL